MLKEKQKGGITLISLVITIVVLLILASVAIGIAVNGNGIFSRAKKAVSDTTIATYKENIETGKLLAILDKQQKGGGGLTIDELIDSLIDQGFIKEQNATRPNESDNNGYIEKDGLVFELRKEENGDITVEYVGESDNIVPSIKVAVSSETATSKVIVTVTGKENINGLASIEQVNGEKRSYEETVKEKVEEFEVTENGEYTYRVTSKIGKSVEEKINISNIDKTKPTGSHTLNPDKDQWGQTVEITVTGKDDNGIKQITGPEGEESKVTQGTTATYVAKANGDYKFKIEDTLGNIADYTVTVSNIDKTEPTGSHTINPPAGEYGKTVTITVTGNDTESGIKQITDQDGKITKAEEGKVEHTLEATYEAKANGKYTFTIEDNVGITKEYEVTINNVTIPVSSITLNPTSLNLKEKETGSITATINPPNATDKTITWRSEDNQIATVEGNGTTATVTGVKAGTTNIVVAAGGKEVKCSVEVKANIPLHNVTITKDNYREYLGKVVTNFRPEGTGETEEVNGCTVGTTYRLYYVDFEGKYGEKGTVYLKADCPKQECVLPFTDTTDVDDTKMKELNPGLYKDKEGSPIDPPDENYNNMKAVKWLLNPTNWESLKTNSPIKDSVNYVVGAPSLEMMMDSYNTYYNLTEDTPDYSKITPGERRTLFYRYTVGGYGYEVGPSANFESEYGSYTSDNSVYTDGSNGIDEMYYPGSGHIYWLASPAAATSARVIYVHYARGGYVNAYTYNECALCPLVSLDSSVQLEFAE